MADDRGISGAYIAYNYRQTTATSSYDMIPSRLQAPANGMPSRTAGFTMIELIVVMIILGALAFVVIPRLDLPSLKVMPAAEQIAAEIRYAQNLALTRAEPYTFEVSGNTISISGPGATLSNGDVSKSFDDVNISGSDITFAPRFGQPSGAASINLEAGSTTATVVVEGETGYVFIQE